MASSGGMAVMSTREELSDLRLSRGRGERVAQGSFCEPAYAALGRSTTMYLGLCGAERSGILRREFFSMKLGRTICITAWRSPVASRRHQPRVIRPTRSIFFSVCRQAGLPMSLPVCSRTASKRKLGQPVVVENKPGSGGNLVGELVAKSTPDGYTLLLAPDSLFVINPHLYASMPFDPLKDLTPVASLVSNYYAFVVSSALPVKTLPDFIALAKRSNPPLFYASFGNGTQSHLGVEMLKQIAQFKLNHVPYRGGAQAGMAVVSGDASLTLGGGGVYPMIQSGQLRPLAVASRERIDELPGVPSVSEFYPSY